MIHMRVLKIYNCVVQLLEIWHKGENLGQSEYYGDRTHLFGTANG